MPDEPQPPTTPMQGGLNPEELLVHGLQSTNHTAWTPPSVEQLQRALPQYDIVALAGRGGMGAVFKARHKRLDRAVAIKVLPASIELDEVGYAERFEREARAMARLSHPNIVAVHDAGETEVGAIPSGPPQSSGPRTAEDSRPYPRLLYFVMDFIEGTDVQRMLAERGQLPAHEALAITTHVLDALAFAHAKGIIHRDIKPSNVLLDAEGNVKVADFGLAKILSGEASLVTGSDMVMGTPAFMAPEAFAGSAKVDHRADLYAVGVMLYQMLTGEVPHGVFDPPSTKVKCDRRVDTIVTKAMQSEPARRYQSTPEMKAAVENLHATRTGGLPSPQAFPRRRSVLLGGALLALALGVVGWFAWKNSDGARVASAVSADRPARAAGSAPGTAHATPATATQDAPFVNTLGMKFVPVPITGGPTGGQRVLFSVWQTRVQDYESFATETHREWPKPIFAHGPTHPAVAVSWDDAQTFCTWLTERERKAGKLGATEHYRLPTDHEWSCAVGVGDMDDPDKAPVDQARIPQLYPWGTQWPPPSGSGNYADEVAKSVPRSDRRGFIDGYDDGYAYTAPVGSFTPNRFGLFDLGSNVHEWCEDLHWPGQLERTLRGASFIHGKPEQLTSTGRTPRGPDNRHDTFGFRVVLAVASALRADPSAPRADATPDRAAARWALGLGGSVTIAAGGKTLTPKTAAELPAGAFVVTEVRLVNPNPKRADLQPLAGLAELSFVSLIGSAVRDAMLTPLAGLPKLNALEVKSSSITDEAIGSIARMPALTKLTLGDNKAFTGRRLGELADRRIIQMALSRTALSSEGLKQIARCRTLQVLDVSRTPITDADIGVLASLDQLTILHVHMTKVTAAGLAALAPLVRLQQLDWTFPREDGPAQIARVAATFPHLPQFALETDGYTPADIPALAAFGELKELQLLRNGATDEMLLALLKLPNLPSVWLRDCRSITGRGLAHLAGHPTMTRVFLLELDQLTDADILQLVPMKPLKTLKVMNCPKITAAGLDAFARARPDVKIER